MKQKHALETYIKSREAQAGARSAHKVMAALNAPQYADEVVRLKVEAEKAISAADREALLFDVDNIATASGLKLSGSLRGVADRMIVIDATGKTVIQNEGVTISPSTFVLMSKTDQLSQAGPTSFLFEGGAAAKKTSSGPNPWRKENRNLTRQAEIMADDPALAQRLKSEAGQ